MKINGGAFRGESIATIQSKLTQDESSNAATKDPKELVGLD